jgi:hypothetical protein
MRTEQPAGAVISRTILPLTDDEMLPASSLNWPNTADILPEYLQFGAGGLS